MAKTYSLKDWANGGFVREMQAVTEEAKEGMIKEVEEKGPAIMEEKSIAQAEEYHPNTIEHIIGQRVAKQWKTERTPEGIALGNVNRDSHRFERGSRGGISIEARNELEKAVSEGGDVIELLDKYIAKVHGI